MSGIDSTAWLAAGALRLIVPTLAVVIPLLRQDAAYLPELLQTLQAQTRLPDEVLIGATDSLQLDSVSLPARFIHNPTGSIPAALNRAIAAAQSEVIVRLDVRARPRPDHLEQCLTTLIASEADVVGGRLEIVPGGPGLMAAAIALAVSHPLGAGNAVYRLAPTAAQTVDTVPYPCFRKSLWQQLGGFNETLWANEDYEFNWRVGERGGRVYLNPAIRVRYLARPALAALARQYFRYGWWKLQMLRQHPRSLRWRQAAPMVALGGAVLAGAVAIGFNLAWPLSLLSLGYLSLLIFSSVQVARAQRSARLVCVLPVAFLTVQLAWSLGAWANLLTFGRWPRR